MASMNLNTGFLSVEVIMFVQPIGGIGETEEFAKNSSTDNDSRCMQIGFE